MKYRSVFLIAFLFFCHFSFAQTFTKKRGRVTETYVNGKRKAKGKVKNYQREGVWKFYGAADELTKVAHYKNGKLSGLCTEYYKDKSKSGEGSYINDSLDGTWTHWFPNGTKEDELNYKRGKFDGICQQWYANGQLRVKENYANGQIIYRWWWYSNGHQWSTEYYKDGLKTGTWRKYDSIAVIDTFPLRIDNYLNGLRDGVHRAYVNEKLAEEIYYKKDLLDGSCKKWERDGKLTSWENYKEGKLDGKCIYYNVDKIARECEYVNGKKNGVEKEYDPGGLLFKQSWYTSDRIDSTYGYHRNGKIAISRVYSYYPGFVRTEIFSTYTEWDKEGHLLLKGKYHFSVKDQVWITYYPNGQNKSVTQYSNGKINGVYKKWYANGKEMIEFECKDGSVVTQPKVWDEKGKLIKPKTKAWQEIVDSSLPGETYNDPNQYKDDRSSQQNSNNSSESQDSGDKQADVSNSGEVYFYVEEMPKFPGADNAFNTFVVSNIKFHKPGEAGGSISFSFVVEKDGTLSDIQLVSGIPGSPELTKEVMRVISTSPKWIPGKMNGKIVRVKMTQRMALDTF